MPNIYPSASLLREIFSYNPEADVLLWSFARDVPARVRGKPALNSRSSNGYRFGSFRGQHLSRHRVIWKLIYGFDAEEIDHINGDIGDDRPINLRSVSHQENCRNRKVYSHNSSGVPGVSWNKRDRKWMAHIHINRRMKNLGMFPEKMDAINARLKAEKELGYVVRGVRDV